MKTFTASNGRVVTEHDDLTLTVTDGKFNKWISPEVAQAVREFYEDGL